MKLLVNFWLTIYTDFPIKNGNPGVNYVDSLNNGGMDVFVSKFNPTTGNLIWSTYYGGMGYQTFYDLAADSQNNLYIVGNSDINTPLVSQANSYNSNSGSGLILKFNSNDSLVWATLFGNNFDVETRDIVTDNNNDVFITGCTKNNGIPIVSFVGGYIDSTYNGTNEEDAFIASFNSNDSLIWSTYYGGNDYDKGTSLTVDNIGNLYVTGITFSNNFPVYDMGGNSFIDSTYSLNNSYSTSDLFVLKFYKCVRKWATLYGDTLFETTWDITSDTDNKIYITGAAGNLFPLCNLTYGYNQTSNTFDDAFILSFSQNDSLIWSTYLGGSSTDCGYGITTFQNKKLYVTGASWSTNTSFLYDLNPGVSWWQPTNYGSSDGFISRFSLIPILPVGVEDNIQPNNNLSIYPNPTTDDLSIVFETKDNEDIRISISNVLGQIVYNEKMEAYNGTNIRKINIAKYATGVYIVNVSTKDRNISRKIIKK